ncbi:30S ribosomal protein S2 [Candidatus Roizmanbacteria bacterium]|nr:30S ribosomal protein S2 [Candidatus Roizmanbacteria bacterium]
MDKAIPSVSEIKRLFQAGLHLGHKKNRLHPKAKQFVYRVESGVSIIDLTQTAKQLTEAKRFVSTLAKEGKTLLTVATKKVASLHAAELSKKYSLPYVTAKWLPGLLTNFDTVIKNVKRLENLKKEKEEHSWEKLTKHEKGQISKRIARLEKFYGGVSSLTRKPDVLFVVDIRKERNAIFEARKAGIPVCGVSDTNADPEVIEYPIVANDDSPQAVEFLISEIIEAYGKAHRKSETPKNEVKG